MISTPAYYHETCYYAGVLKTSKKILVVLPRVSRLRGSLFRRKSADPHRTLGLLRVRGVSND